MYKTFTATDYKKHMKLPDAYEIAGLMIYGTFRTYPFEQFEESLKHKNLKFKKTKLEHDFFNSLLEFEVEEKKYWIATAYGGALLSEYLHLACLFGSKKNISKKSLLDLSIPVPPLEEQRNITKEIQAEQKAVEENRKLIMAMKKKIAAKIAEVWGE